MLKKGEAALGMAAGLEGDWERLDIWPLFTKDFAAQLITKKSRR